jgi:uncharacterized protein
MNVASILWRRLDVPGHDACRLIQRHDGWDVEGTAVFRLDGAPARLDYRVGCDAAWRSRQGHVRGWIGGRSVEHVVARTEVGAWTLDGTGVDAVQHGIDLDFGFTPATNLFQLRRLALAPGQAGDAPAAWLDVSSGTLDLLVQRYECRSNTTYWYEAPRFGYAGLLETDLAGFVHHYPQLWRIET